MTETSAQTEFSGVRAAIHLYLPLYTPHLTRFRAALLRADGWQTVSPDTRFYMRYIERIFRSDDHDALSASCLVMQNDRVHYTLSIRERNISLNAVRIYSFDTSIAILDLRIFTECDTPDTVSDLASILRMTDTKIGRAIPFIESEDPSDSTQYEDVTLNKIAEELLTPLGKYRLFDHLGENGSTRADVFATIVADESTADVDLNAYRIASGFDARYHGEIPEASTFSQFSHLRWTVTGKGVCSVGLLTADPSNRSFIQNSWTSISESRHVLWYMLVLHQKYAMYHYLNEIADREHPARLREYQRKIVRFNTKYRFDIVADDPAYQRPYQMARDEKSVESVFSDIDEEIERINDYQNVVADKNNVVAMTIVSLVCAISTFVDLLTWLSGGTSLGDLFGTFSLGQSILLLLVLAAMAIALGILIIKPIVTRLCGWLKIRLSRIAIRLFFRK